jgi:alkanesulfonate monooxygenase SsuD/methylene tetrahydromethanopterin reductase-like flavin-dependent oxidoreductase (luciferase family)
VDPRPALAPRSISLRLYPHTGLDADVVVDELRTQAALAVAAGFDGIMTSEHHGGFAGYMPNPLQAAGWLLDAMSAGWAAPCPLLLPLRPPALVAEEVAWLAARHPGRVGLGMAAGSLVDDFEIMGLTKENLTERFADGLALVAGALGGRHPGRLAADPAVARCRTFPVPMVSAAMSPAAVRRAAGLAVGIIFDSLSTTERVRLLVDAYRAAGGNRACILIRRVWVGPPPTGEIARQVNVYRSYAAAGAQSHWTADELIAAEEPGVVADTLFDVMSRSGSDACNLRLHAPGIAPAQIREQIEALADVATRLRSLMAAGSTI